MNDLKSSLDSFSVVECDQLIVLVHMWVTAVTAWNGDQLIDGVGRSVSRSEERSQSHDRVECGPLAPICSVLVLDDTRL